MGYPVKTVDQLVSLLKAFRQTAGLTQAELAERLGITQQTYARLEANPKVVSLDRFLRVLAVLDVQMTLDHAAPSARQPQKKPRSKAAKPRPAPVAKPTKKAAAKIAGKSPTPVISRRERW